jgi:hypothetical protein
MIRQSTILKGENTMDLNLILRVLHSGVRWVVVIIALVALVYMALGFIQKREWDKRAQTFLTMFSSTIGLQWMIGIVFLISWGSLTGFGIRHYWEHLVVQTIALGVAHMHFSWRKRDMSANMRYRNGALLILGVFGLIFIGILVLPAGIQWRLYTGAPV